MPTRYDNLFTALAQVNGNSKLEKPLRILEIGVYDGGRAVQMIEATKKMGRKSVHYFGYDLWELLTPEQSRSEQSKPKLPPSKASVEAKIKKTGAGVFLRQGNTRETLPRSISGMPVMDLIFIDGGHSLESIASDWSHCSQLMGAKTVVLFDDYWPDRDDAGCKTLINQLRGVETYRVELLDPIDHYSHTGVTTRFARVTKR